MDLRATVIVIAVVACGGAPAWSRAGDGDSPAWSQSGDVDSLSWSREGDVDSLVGPAWDALQAESEIDLEAVTRVEWDALLADPVELNRGDLERLRVLPWIGAAEIATLAAARPFDTLDDLARLPGLDPQAAARLRPFVEVAPGHAAAPAWGARLQWRTSATRARLASGPATLAGSFDAAAPRRTTGALRFVTRRWRLGAGDVRASHAQGLLLWGGDSATRAGAPAWREARGTSALEGFDRDHALRGGSCEWTGTRLRWMALCGAHALGRGAVLGCAWRVAPRCELRAAALGLGPLRGASLGFGIGAPATRVAAEVAGWGTRWAATAAVDLRRGKARLAARLQATPFDAPLPLGALAAASRRTPGREAQLGFAWHRGRVACEIGALETRRDGEGGAARVKREQAMSWTARLAREAVSLRVVRRVTQEDAWADATTLETRPETDWSWVLHVRRTLRTGWSGVATLRGALQLHGAGAAAGAGRAWQVRVERDAGRWRPGLGLGAFDVEPGIVLVESAPAGGFGTSRLRGDGIRATAAVRGTWRALLVRAGAWSEWGAAQARRAGGEAAIGMSLP